jgi:hypothetical protein
LFLVCVFSVPCLYYAVVIVGIAPVSVMSGLAFLWFPKPGAEKGMTILGLLSVLNVAVWGAVIFVICRLTIRAIYAKFSRSAGWVVAAIMGGVASIGLLPFYWVAGHGMPREQSAYALLIQLVTSRL